MNDFIFVPISPTSFVSVRGFSGSGDALSVGAYAIEAVNAGRDARYLRRHRHESVRRDQAGGVHVSVLWKAPFAVGAGSRGVTEHFG